LPVQCSASGRSALESTCCAAEPTAQHRVAPGHQTPRRSSAARPAGSGSTVSNHVLPFQCSAIGSFLVDPSVALPAAQQFSRTAQDTPLSNVSADPATLGLAFGDHLVPFQCSIKVRVTPDAVWSPTAQQEAARGQVTPMRARLLGVTADTAGAAAAAITASRAAAKAKNRIIDRYVMAKPLTPQADRRRAVGAARSALRGWRHPRKRFAVAGDPSTGFGS